MHWIIQSNLVGADDVARLIRALERCGVAYTCVRLVPIVRRLECVPQIDGPAFVYGSTFLHRSAYDHGWTPGYIGGRVDHGQVTERLGARMLNPDMKIVSLAGLSVAEAAFIRPLDDGKLFTGAVMDSNRIERVRRQVMRENPEDPMAGQALVAVSTPKTLLAEYRLLVVDGQVVCASSYRIGKRVVYQSRVDERIVAFGQECVDMYNPDLGFALDVADTPEGLRVVEINALSSAGLYACDLNLFVDAMDRLGDRLVAERGAKSGAPTKGPCS